MSAPRPSDRRSVPRHPCPLETYCRACSISDDDLWWRGEIWDISIAGVGLILTRSFETGSNLEIEVPLANVRTLAVHVEYVTQQVDGSWFLGCTFLDRLDDATVKAIVELTAAAPASV